MWLPSMQNYSFVFIHTLNGCLVLSLLTTKDIKIYKKHELTHFMTLTCRK